MAHVEGYYSTLSRAFKDDNPGNIMVFTDGVRAEKVYPSKLAGFTGLVDDIAANAGKPLNEFIAKYAPPNENNTSLYLQEVSTLSGIGETETL